MWEWSDKLRLGKSSAFVKRDLRRLPLTEVDFEADFFLDAAPSNRHGERWMGMVIERESGDVLATEDVRLGPPTVNDLAALLAHAMLRPLNAGDRQRPRTIYLRERPQWQELLPHLRQLGIEVVSREDLPEFDEAVLDWMQQTKAKKQLSADEIHAALRQPFPQRKPSRLAEAIDPMAWTEAMPKGAYPPCKGAVPSNDPRIVMSNTDEPAFPLRLTEAQRRVIAGLAPHLQPRLALDQANERTPRFTLAELKEIARVCRAAVPRVPTGMERNSLRHVADAAEEAVNKFGEGKIYRIPVAERLYQFKITLKDIQPPIWRRILVKDCSLDKLHEHIQTAMGWTNSHLHQFTIGGVLHGDPELLCEGWEDEIQPVDSLYTKISTIIPEDGKRFRFEYEYDFGDGWEHEVLFEGCLRAEKGARYPLCVEGERACPPEDVGGTSGYQEYLEAMADPEHEERESFMRWRGPFDPEQFDTRMATRRMRRGLPDWRREAWI
jgi:hypothetical protein